MYSSINKKLILDNDTQDLMSEKQRTYFSEKLQEAESYNMLSKYADKTKWPEELSAMEGELKAKHEKSM